MNNQKNWDVFCKIVDNFGDIGVCWRLARQLHTEHGLQVRLFVTQLELASKILVGISNCTEQTYEGVSIVRWDEKTIFATSADVVIETFSCELPEAYLTNMDNKTVWVNVDYLSAEDWVPEFHGLNSQHQQANRLRHFYFPGFSSDTGGLLREQTLISQRDSFQQSEQEIHDFFLQSLFIDHDRHGLKISLFSYQNAPVEQFLQTLAKENRAVSVFMPISYGQSASLLGQDGLKVGDAITIGGLTLHLLPFLNQTDYDRLLWACDINFVRGEDSWIRAVWAGKPFIWQPYWQTDNAHLLKLNAFLDRFYGQPEFMKILLRIHEMWSTEQFQTEAWHEYLTNLPAIARLTQQQSNLLIQQKDLATNLVDFCANLAK
ncbi:MAG: elongation factor P maturation arginine rhamnosyltransferase EarP [Methylotenera sp.]